MKKYLALLLALVMVLALVACGQSKSSAAPAESAATAAPAAEENKPVKITFAELNSETSQPGQWCYHIMELAKAADVGLDFDFYPNGSLVSQDMEAVQGGLCDMMMLTYSTGASIYGPMAAFDAPYIFTTAEQSDKIFDINSPAMTYLNENIVPLGVRCLGAYYAGNRQTTTTEKPLYSVDDMKGLKLRVVNGELYIRLFRAFGCEPTPMAFSEVPAALVTGVVEGQENPYASITASKFWDIQKYVIETNHMPANYPMFVNEAFFQKLSPAQQKALTDAVQQASRERTKIIGDAIDSDRQLCKDNGMTIITEADGLDLESFTKAAMAIYDDYKTEWGEMPDKIRSCYN